MNFLVIVLSSQLLYYLLIAQTGVVGAFDSHIDDLYTLPIGGVIGTVLSGLWRHNAIRFELYTMFVIQLIVSSLYPNYSLVILFILGFAVGYTTPLLLHLFSEQKRLSLALGLAISYAFGTYFYSCPFLQRGMIAIILPLISLAALALSGSIPSAPIQRAKMEYGSVLIMMIWIFADSALFETLSRSNGMDIWSRYPYLIIITHLVGVYLAYRQNRGLIENSYVILGMFGMSYFFYYVQEPIWLAIIYPVAISYYNVLLFEKIISMVDIRIIAFMMLGVGWIASSLANLIALEHQFWMASSILGIFAVIYPILQRKTE